MKSIILLLSILGANEPKFSLVQSPSLQMKESKLFWVVKCQGQGISEILHIIGKGAENNIVFSVTLQQLEEPYLKGLCTGLHNSRST